MSTNKKIAGTAKKSFVLYDDFHPQLEMMTVEQAGHLLKAIYSHRNNSDYSFDDPIVRFALKGIISQLDRDEAKYRAICAKRSEYGIKGAKQKLAKAGKRKHKLASEADSGNDSDSVNGSDTNKDCIEFLNKFNKTTGKKHRTLPTKATKQFKARLKEGYSIDDLITAAKNACADKYHKEAGLKYVTPEFITRGDKLEHWLNSSAPITEEPDYVY